MLVRFRYCVGKRVLEMLDETFDHSYLQQFVRERLERREPLRRRCCIREESAPERSAASDP